MNLSVIYCLDVKTQRQVSVCSISCIVLNGIGKIGKKLLPLLQCLFADSSLLDKIQWSNVLRYYFLKLADSLKLGAPVVVV